MVHGLSCPVARGILADQGSNLCLLLWQMDSLTTGPQQKYKIYSLIQFGKRKNNKADAVIWSADFKITCENFQFPFPLSYLSDYMSSPFIQYTYLYRYFRSLYTCINRQFQKSNNQIILCCLPGSILPSSLHPTNFSRSASLREGLLGCTCHLQQLPICSFPAQFLLTSGTLILHT